MQTEDQQNQQLLDLSKQILRLTRELRSYANTVQAEDKQNRELIDLSRQTLTLTKQVDARLASDGRPDSDSSGGGRPHRPPPVDLCRIAAAPKSPETGR